MNMKTTNKMRGLMCQSPGATAVCMPGDPRSVVVPRRPDRSLVDDSMLINSKYYRLIEPRRLSSLGDNRPAPLSLSSSIRREREFERRSSSTCSIPTSLASSDQAFQVRVVHNNHLFRIFLSPLFLFLYLLLDCRKEFCNHMKSRVGSLLQRWHPTLSVLITEIIFNS
uniref:Uncharacterized protein n=1 Tax=Nelumbo nucifera TaxID=4432 RepID=A0A822Z5A7_NELNU|nr:TPA_asm: hypothetical protein HUJ06_014585 [Nelumbo nucifera]